MYAIVERRLGLIERVVLAKTSQKAILAFKKMLKQNDVECDQEILNDGSFADFCGFEIKLTYAEWA